MLLPLAILICVHGLQIRPQPILVIGYHEIGGPAEFPGGPRYDIHGLNISVATFRRQLGVMHDNGYWPITMRDVIRHRKIPKEKRPIVLTFDDGRATQFKYLPNGKLDSNCAVRVMVDFHHHHPDWPMRGSFYLIAGSDKNGVPFDQEGLERQKVRQLLKWGFEIGNHSLTHPSFRYLTDRQIMREIAVGAAYLKRLTPGIQVDTFALPYGQLPIHAQTWPLLRQPPAPSRSYKNIGVLLFDPAPQLSPDKATFNPFLIQRMAPAPGRVEGILTNKSKE